MKKRYIKTALKIILSAVFLLLIIVAIGIAYIKYSGENESVSPTSPPTSAEAPVIKPPKISPKAKESAVIETISSPVKRGSSSASINVRTNPNSKCKIEVNYKDKDGNSIQYKRYSLMEKKADEYGVISWEWPMAGSALPGTWKVKVTCVYNKKSAVVIGDMTVQ